MTRGDHMSIEHWEIASSSKIHFTVRHLLFSKVRGRFTRWSGTLLVPDGDWDRATVDVVIDASSIDTGIAKRDTDLRTANFLDVERYPVITFRTLYVTARQADALQIVGELTMKGRVGEVILEAESSGVALDESGSERARFSAKAAIRRRDFGASGNVAWDRLRRHDRRTHRHRDRCRSREATRGRNFVQQRHPRSDGDPSLGSFARGRPRGLPSSNRGGHLRTITLLWTAGLVLLARGAAAQDVNYDYDRHANFAAYRTYAWVGGTTLAADDLNHARIVAAVDRRAGGEGPGPGGQHR